MSDLLIRDIPDPLKREIAQAARTRGQSLSTKAIDLLRKGLVAEQETKPAARISLGHFAVRIRKEWSARWLVRESDGGN